MIIQEAVSAPVITSIGVIPSKFKIKASAKAFKILSGFYSDPVLAIPRELGANAWDAHVKAGNTKQMFEVHAPNNLEPWFSIRDFGTGLSPEDIDQIYTTYFESTKTQDNDSDGCMGLGSKTPFNYTENFTVTSYFNGTKYVYNCFIDESGAPNILPLANEPTKEHNGLEVRFGVKISDISTFTDKIARAYEPFRFRPVIKGTNINFKPREYQFEGTGWGLRKSDSRYDRSGCRAFMGNYSYPINYESLRNYLAEDTKFGNQIYRMLSNGTFDLFFNIGDLEVAPNKEALQYDADNKTAKAIFERCRIAYDQLMQKVISSIENPKTMWEAMALYVRYNSYHSEYNHIRSIVGDLKINYRGTEITSGIISLDAVNQLSGLSETQPGVQKGPYSVAKLPHHFSIGVLSYRTSSDKFIIRDKGYYYVDEKGDFPEFLYTNTENLKKSRIRHYLKTKYPKGDIPNTMIVHDFSPNLEYFKTHCKYLGIPDTKLINIDTLPKPPRVPCEQRTATTDEIHFVAYSNIDATGRRGQYYNNVHWQKEAHTFNAVDTYYYVDFFYSDQMWNGKRISDQIDAILRFIKKNKLLPENLDKIWGINKKNSKLLKVGKWINVVDLAKKGMEKHQAEYEQNLYLLSFNDVVSRLAHVRHIISNTTLLNYVNNKDTIKKLKALIDINKQICEISQDIIHLCNLFGVKSKKHVDLDVNPQEFEKELSSKYMGIFMIVDRYNCCGNQLAQLINFIDEKS